MVEVTEEVIQEIVRRFLAVADPRQIVLFGSWARGDARADSDVDMLVVEDGPFNAENSRRDVAVKLDRALRGLRVPVDILVFTPDEVEKWRRSINHVVFDALQEGRLLYDRSSPRSRDAGEGRGGPDRSASDG
ncbi:MAG: nucleotidyltransferase domain-containing protein [Armatimonadetes bacterium]|nr:nucleotidyltransferase domain-containing protein [Armatimonadota bacterium]